MFLAHTHDVKSGFSQPLSQFNNKKFITNQAGEFKLANNICPHQGSLIVSGVSTQIKCRYHGWEWDANGNPVSQGHTGVCNKSKVAMSPCYESNGLLFSQDINIPAEIPFTDFKLVESRTDNVNANYKTIMNVFLDVDHIPVVHKDVYTDLGIGDDPNVSWDYYDWGSMQSVASSKSTELAAIWIAVYPFTMIEWQANALFITVCVPENNATRVSVFKYMQNDTAASDWKENEKMWETAWSQDKEQAECIVGRAPTNNLEQQKIHFLNWTENATNVQ
jgi:phenylpropionate dioxygenase-like ring-hydroxylating dioxygenase large terminal subunit